MKQHKITIGIAVIAYFLLTSYTLHPEKAKGFAVLELFTSEGCSSCPPADALIANLQKENKDLYVLAYHVDYWDHQGWKDKFSNADNTARQRRYADWLKLETVYTPQIVLNGTSEYVGSNETEIRKGITNALNAASETTLTLNSKIANKNLNIDYQTTADEKTSVLVLALVQHTGQSNVKAGENQGRNLSHVQIVRRLTTVDLRSKKPISIELPEDYKAKDFELIGFIQRKTDGHILAAAKNTPTMLSNIKQINAGDLNVGYTESGPANGPAVILLHGWPYDINSFAEVAPILSAKGYRVIIPYLRGYGTTRFLDAATLRNGEPAALASDIIALMDALHIPKAILGGFDWGARTADIVAALWPQRVKALVSVSGYLLSSQEAGKQPLPPTAEHDWWYQYYFATERGREGYEKYRTEFSKLIWQRASPKWNFDDATFQQSAAAFDNPDHVSIVIHNYRWRLALVEGESRYADLEKRIAAAPQITVPTITLEGDANGAPHPAPEAYRQKFTGRYTHRTLTGGIGHNLPQEAPQAFADAIVEVDGY